MQRLRHRLLSSCSRIHRVVCKASILGVLVALADPLFCAEAPLVQTSGLGVFEGQTDIGQVGEPGHAHFDPTRRTYTVTGSGSNMWFSSDAFHLVWKRLSGDVSLTAEVQWPKAGGNAHRKACLIIRQSLATSSAYADAALHGDGLCSLQEREAEGAPTREIQSNVSGPTRLRIEKQGDTVAMWIGQGTEPMRPAGGSFRLPLSEPFYVGLGVCSHDNSVSETAVFSHVDLRRGPFPLATNAVVESTLETVAIASQDRRVAYHTRGVIEAPNWSRDGSFLIFNSRGHLYRLSRGGGEPVVINTGAATRCNNDHGLSPDGLQLSISDQTERGGSRIYVLPANGGNPRQITKSAPSYWHGWSPDGQTLAYCAERNGNFDIYTIPVSGGEETRLTTADGLDDGPDYTPDGKYIYFNSERTGHMQIWRMRPDGSQQEQVTSGSQNDWFPHPSPDGKWLVFLSYRSDVKGHPANQEVELRIQPMAGGPGRVLAQLFGGQGTINVPSWSPDSKQVAFVSYRLVNP